MAAVTNGQPRSSGRGTTDSGGPGKALVAALGEAGCSSPSLALRVGETGRCQGADTNYGKTSVTQSRSGPGAGPEERSFVEQQPDGPLIAAPAARGHQDLPVPHPDNPSTTSTQLCPVPLSSAAAPAAAARTRRTRKEAHHDGSHDRRTSPPAPWHTGPRLGLVSRRGDAPLISLSGPPRLLRVAVAAHPSCAAAVRRVVAAHLRLWRLPHLVDDTVLATDELFANAVRHTSAGPCDTVAVSLEYSGDEVRVTLADSSPVLPRPRRPGAGAETGRGLSIVDALADDWGTDLAGPGERGKKVWFTIAVRATT